MTAPRTWPSSTSPGRAHRSTIRSWPSSWPIWSGSTRWATRVQASSGGCRTTDGNATGLDQPFGPEIIVNMTVWEDVESLRASSSAASTSHFCADGASGSSKLDGPPTVLWWVRGRPSPTLDEAKERLEQLASAGRRRGVHLRPRFRCGWAADAPRAGRMSAMPARPHPGRRPRQHGPQPCARLPSSGRLRDRRPDEPHHPLDRGQAAGRAAGLPAVRGLRAGAARDAARRGLDQYLHRHARGLCHPRHGGGLPRLLRKAAGDHHRGRRGRRREGGARPGASSCSATSCASTPPGRS